jgi:hypothetical protein
LRELILEQAKINDNIAKKLAANDRILENINIKMDSFSSAIKDQLSYNRGGKSTRGPPYPKGTGRTPAALVVLEEKKDDEVEEVVRQESQDQGMRQDFHDTTSYHSHEEIEESKRMSSLVSL